MNNSRRKRISKIADALNELSFLRVSKSCIMNTGMIRSVRKNITGASEVEFTDSVKKA